MSKRKTFILAVAVPLLILLAMTVKPLTAVFCGQEILLQTRAVDPNESFRGDYIYLSYNICDIPKTMLPDTVKQYSEDRSKNINLYVSLKQAGRFYVVDKVLEKKPESGIFLKGRLDYYNFSQMPDTVYINYSLDKYFVPQGSGQGLDDQSSKGGLVARVKVLHGYGILSGIEPGSN